MSGNDRAHVHRQPYSCTACMEGVLTSTGSMFGGVPSQQTYRSGNLPPEQQRRQVNQGNAELRAFANNPALRENWTSLNPNPTVRAALTQGPTPTQHPYATELQFDEPSGPAPVQPRHDTRRPADRPTSTPGYDAPNVNGSVDSGSLAAGHQSRPATAVRAHDRAPLVHLGNYGYSPYRQRDEAAASTSRRPDARQVDQRATPTPSRPSRQPAGRTFTPSSSSED